MTTFRQLLSGFEEAAKTRAVQGRHFERLRETFFRLAAIPGYEFDKVWARDGPGKDKRGDTGIDLVGAQGRIRRPRRHPVQVLRTHRDTGMAAGLHLCRDARPASVRGRDDRLDCGRRAGGV